MSENQQTSEREIVQVKAEPVLVEQRSVEIRQPQPVPQAVRWLGAALVFAGREIVPVWQRSC